MCTNPSFLSKARNQERQKVWNKQRRIHVSFHVSKKKLACFHVLIIWEFIKCYIGGTALFVCLCEMSFPTFSSNHMIKIYSHISFLSQGKKFVKVSKVLATYRCATLSAHLEWANGTDKSNFSENYVTSDHDFHILIFL